MCAKPGACGDIKLTISCSQRAYHLLRETGDRKPSVVMKRMKCVLNKSTASQRICVFAQRNGGVLRPGLHTCHRRMVVAIGGKRVSRASLVEGTVRANKRWAEDSFHSWRVESCLVGQEWMDHGSD